MSGTIIRTRLAVSPQYIWHILFEENNIQIENKNTTPQQQQKKKQQKDKSSATNKVSMTIHKYNQLHF